MKITSVLLGLLFVTISVNAEIVGTAQVAEPLEHMRISDPQVIIKTAREDDLRVFLENISLQYKAGNRLAQQALATPYSELNTIGMQICASRGLQFDKVERSFDYNVRDFTAERGVLISGNMNASVETEESFIERFPKSENPSLKDQKNWISSIKNVVCIKSR